MRNPHRGVKCSARRRLHAMVWPQYLPSVKHCNRLVGRTARVTRGKGQMSWRMPILRQHDVFELLRKLVDYGHDLVAVRHGKRSTRAEIILYVDHDEDVIVRDCISLGQFSLLMFSNINFK